MAGFVVSMVAVAVSLVAVVYSRRQAANTRRLAQIETERRELECRPRLTARPQYFFGQHWIWIGDEGPGDVDTLAVSAVDRNDRATSRLRGFYDGAVHGYQRKVEVGPVRLGSGAHVMVDVELDYRQRSQPVQVRCDYANAAGGWVSLLTVDFAAMEYPR